MTINENNNFRNVSVYTLNNVSEKTLKKAGKSFHMNDRDNRLKTVLKIEKQMKIDRSFLVDKGHKDGQEVHVVTTNGIIFIYNFMKLFSCSQNALVTILIARPNQVKRLYESCNIPLNDDILKKCAEHAEQGLNK